MEDRFDFVEPLLHMGLDPFVGDNDGQPAYEMNVSSGNESQNLALHKLSLSQGVYDEVANGGTLSDFWVMQRMMGNLQVFDSINVFPDFYQRPLLLRIDILIWLQDLLDWTTVTRLFRPHGGFYPEDLLHRIPRTGQTIFQWATKAYLYPKREIHRRMMIVEGPVWGHYFSLFNKEDLEGARGLIHDIVAVSEYSDLSATGERGRTTALLEGIRSSTGAVTHLWISNGQAYNARVHRLAKGRVQLIVKDWLKVLWAGGKDLEVFGQAELTILLRHRSSGSPGWNTRGARYGWKGLTVGPRPENWHLIWEWDPDVEGFVGDFWEWIENPPLAIPGSWVDDDDDDDSDWYEDEDEDPWLMCRERGDRAGLRRGLSYPDT